MSAKQIFSKKIYIYKSGLFKVLMLFILIIAGCSSEKKSNKAQDSAGDKIDESALATHAPMYFEENAGININYWKEGVFDEVCNSDFLGERSNTEGLKYLSIALTDYKDGVYPIGFSLDPALGPVAVVRSITEHGYSYEFGREDYHAYRGTVEIKKLSQENLGLTGDIEVYVKAEFAKNPISLYECQDVWDVEGNYIEGKCTCVDSNHQTSECEIFSFDDQCCLDLEAETKTVEYSFTSKYCSLYCAEVSSLWQSMCAHEPGYQRDTLNDGLSVLTHEDFQSCSFAYRDSFEKSENELYIIGHLPFSSRCPGYDNDRSILQIYGEKKIEINEQWQTLEPEIYSQVAPFFILNSIWKSMVGDIYFAGVNGVVIHYNEVEMSILKDDLFDSGDHYYGIWGNDQGELFVCGQNGAFLHMKDNTWSKIDLGTTENLSSVVGNDKGEVVVVGEGGVARMYKDEEWINIDVEESVNMHDVWFSPSGELFAVSGRYDTSVTYPGIIWQFDDEKWVEVVREEGDVLSSISGNNEEVVYAVGYVKDENGTLRPVVWKRENNSWTRVQHNQSIGTLFGVNCLSNNKCYAYGSNNIFFEL